MHHRSLCLVNSALSKTGFRSGSGFVQCVVPELKKDHNSYRLSDNFRQPTFNIAGKLADYLMYNFHAPTEKNVVDTLEIKEDDIVLEVGSGSGIGLLHGSEFIKGYGTGMVYGLEPSSFMYYKSELRCLYPVSMDKAKLVHGRVENIPFDRNFFNAIFTCNTFYYWSDLRKACDEMFRVLKPGGRFIATGLRENFKLASGGARIILNGDEAFLESLKTAGFSDVKVGELKRKTLFRKKPVQAVFAWKH